MSEIIKPSIELKTLDIFQYVDINETKYGETYTILEGLVRLRRTHFSSKNKTDECERIRIKVHKKSILFTDSIRDESYLIGLIKVYTEYKKHYPNFELSLERLVRIIKDYNLKFHHNDFDSMNNAYDNLDLVNDNLHNYHHCLIPSVKEKIKARLTYKPAGELIPAII